MNDTVPEIRLKVAERNAAKLDFDAYQRRYEAYLAKQGSASTSLAALRQKLVKRVYACLLDLPDLFSSSKKNRKHFACVCIFLKNDFCISRVANSANWCQQETSEARYNGLNARLKDLIVKTKIARDGLIEDAAVTFIVCQEQMFKVQKRERERESLQIPLVSLLPP